MTKVVGVPARCRALYPLTSTTGGSFMRLYVMGFAAGVWWLQQQAQLPVPHFYWLAAPMAFGAGGSAYAFAGLAVGAARGSRCMLCGLRRAVGRVACAIAPRR